MVIDELRIYRGQDYKISEKITIYQPTLDEITDYGEQEYYSMVYKLTSTPADLKWQLFDIGVDYTKIDNFDLFSSYLIIGYSIEQTSIIFKDLDFSKFKIYKDINTDEKFMGQINTEVIDGVEYEGEPIKIDSYTYELIADILRKIHGLKKNEQVPANESTKQVLIDDAREEFERNKNKEPHSYLLNLISTMVNCEGFKYNHSEVWGMKINAFMDSVKRISKIKNADILLQSGYSGNGINLKEIDKKQLDWQGELD